MRFPRISDVITFQFLSWLLYNVLLFLVPKDKHPNPDRGLNVIQLLTKNGYDSEKHSVTTEDGYILELFRISNSTKESKKGPPVLMVHGIVFSSYVWILEGIEKGLAYNLADAGYDVWLGNTRGNYYARNHTTLNPDEDEFWNFSFHEIGYYDIPAMINHVLNKTEHDKIFYISHSQGSTSLFVMLAKRPEINQKLKLGITMAPVVFAKDISIRFLNIPALYYELPIRTLETVFGIKELLPYSREFGDFIYLLCKTDSPFQKVCLYLAAALCGYNEEEMDKKRLNLIVQGTGASMQQVYHYFQSMHSDEFREYDYGIFENLKRYQRITPPDYNLTNVRAPLAIFYGQNDVLSRVYDVEKLTKRLKNKVIKYLVPNKKFNHFDYIWNLNVTQLVNIPVLKLLAKFQ